MLAPWQKSYDKLHNAKKQRHHFASKDVAFAVVSVSHSLSSEEQASFKFMSAATVCIDFKAQENEI